MPLTDEQYDEYAATRGSQLHTRLSALVSQPGFDNLAPEMQIRTIKKVQDHTDAAVEKWMLMQHPDIVAQATANKQKLLGGTPAERPPLLPLAKSE